VSTKSGCQDSIIEATAVSFRFPLPKSPTTAKVNLAARAGAARNVPLASTPESVPTVYVYASRRQAVQPGDVVDAGAGVDAGAVPQGHEGVLRAAVRNEMIALRCVTLSATGRGQRDGGDGRGDHRDRSASSATSAILRTRPVASHSLHSR